MNSCCPTCGQLLPSKRGHRICSACGRRIRRHDKWFFGIDSKPQHHNCQSPETPDKEPDQASMPLAMEAIA